MGDLKALNECVVDLYAVYESFKPHIQGIGYFTIPIAVKTGVRHMYCFEINDDSVQALQKNVEQNGVQNICEVRALLENDEQIIPGDNRVTTQSYHNLADRVLLGLLPSSREGWPLAMQILKKEGGMLHVHENVHDSEYEQYVQSLPKELEQLGERKGKKYHCKIDHIERVKSYAPKVYHYVFDVKCYQVELCVCC